MSDRPRRTPEERLSRSIRSMSPGSAGGRIAQAMPVRTRRFDHTDLPDLEDDIGSQAIVKFHQDRHVLDSAGDRLVRLTYVPIPNSEHVYWNGVYQPASEWSRSANAIKLNDSGGVLAMGDEVEVEYAYHPQDSTPALPIHIGTSLVEGAYPTHTLPLPAGAQEGDLFVVVTNWQVSADCDDPRLFEEIAIVQNWKVFWGMLDGSSDPVVVTGDSGSLSSWNSSGLSVLRGVTVGGWVNDPIATPPQPAKVYSDAEAVLVAGIANNGTIAGTNLYENGLPTQYTRIMDASYAKNHCALFLWAPDDGPIGNPPSSFTTNGTANQILLVTLNLLGQ